MKTTNANEFFVHTVMPPIKVRMKLFKNLFLFSLLVLSTIHNYNTLCIVDRNNVLRWVLSVPGPPPPAGPLLTYPLYGCP